MSKKTEEIVLADKNEAVKVCIRCRPLNDKEKANGNEKVVSVPPGRSEIFVIRPGGNEEPKQFTFDLTYGDDAMQEKIYLQTSSPIINNVLEGYNGTIFAYG